MMMKVSYRRQDQSPDVQRATQRRNAADEARREWSFVADLGVLRTQGRIL
jgi:hypothetical protein